MLFKNNSDKELLKNSSENEIVAKIEQLNTLNYSDLESEMSLLACLIVNSSLMLETILVLYPKDFSVFEHSEIFSILRNMFENEEPFDPLTIIQKIEQLERSEEIKSCFFNIIKQEVLMFKFKDYIKKIINCSVKKRIHCLSQDMLKVTTTDQDPTQIIDTASNLLINLLTSITNTNDRDIVDLTLKSNDLVRHIFSEQQNGLTTGFPTLDSLLYGFIPAEVTVLAARPSVGKTALSLFMGLAAAVQNKTHVLFFSLEMSVKKIGERILSSLFKTPINELKKFHETHNEEEIANKLINSNMTIIHTPTLSIDVIKNLSRSQKLKKNNIGLIIIDYIQLIEIKGKFENRQYEMAKITREIKNLSSELQLPILVLSQVTRDVDQFAKPKLSHLKSSGTIEEHFDNIILIHQDYTNTRQMDDKQQHVLKHKNLELILAKHRNGPTGNVKIKFYQDINIFSES